MDEAAAWGSALLDIDRFLARHLPKSRHLRWVREQLAEASARGFLFVSTRVPPGAKPGTGTIAGVAIGFPVREFSPTHTCKDSVPDGDLLYGAFLWTGPRHRGWGTDTPGMRILGEMLRSCAKAFPHTSEMGYYRAGVRPGDSRLRTVKIRRKVTANV